MNRRTLLAGGCAELEAEGNELPLYLSDNCYRPRCGEGANSQVVVFSQGWRTIVALAPGGSDLLRGQGDFTAAAGMRVVVTLAMPGQRPAQGRFTPRDQG